MIKYQVQFCRTVADPGEGWSSLTVCSESGSVLTVVGQRPTLPTWTFLTQG